MVTLDFKPGRRCVIRGKVVHLLCLRVTSYQENLQLRRPKVFTTPYEHIQYEPSQRR